MKLRKGSYQAILYLINYNYGKHEKSKIYKKIAKSLLKSDTVPDALTLR